jgi:uncharacterized protein
MRINLFVRRLGPLAGVLLLAVASPNVSLAAEVLSPADAVKAGDKVALRQLLQKRVDVNAPSGDGTTALHWASYRDDLESADLLIRAGAKVNVTNDLGATPLWLAAVNGGAAMTTRLLAAGADPNLALTLGETSLMAASRTGNADVVTQLLAKGANVNATAVRGQTALMWAAAQRHSAVVKALLANKADVHARTDTWTLTIAVQPSGHPDYRRPVPQGGDTALMFAARSGDAEIATLLLNAGANVNDADAYGVSATLMAAHSNFTDVMHVLLERGADPNADKAGFTALQTAILWRNEAAAVDLLAHGANPNTPVKSWTFQRRAARQDHYLPPAVVGATPYWLASRIAAPRLMKLLAENGADTSFVHRASYHRAGDEGAQATPIVEATTPLLAAVGIGGGIDWNPVAARERQANMLDAVKIALQYGNDVNATTLDGKTALDGAMAAKFDSVSNFLIERGGKVGTGMVPVRPPREQ